MEKGINVETRGRDAVRERPCELRPGTAMPPHNFKSGRLSRTSLKFLTLLFVDPPDNQKAAGPRAERHILATRLELART